MKVVIERLIKRSHLPTPGYVWRAAKAAGWSAASPLASPPWASTNKEGRSALIIGGTISTRKRRFCRSQDTTRKSGTRERETRPSTFSNDFVYRTVLTIPPLTYYTIQLLPLLGRSFIFFSLLFFFFTIQSIRQCTARVFFIAFEISKEGWKKGGREDVHINITGWPERSFLTSNGDRPHLLLLSLLHLRERWFCTCHWVHLLSSHRACE